MEKWEGRNEYVKTLTPVKSLDEIKKSGIQMTHLLNTVYIDSSEAHSLVIGDTGSGKTQMITLPLIKTSIKAGDSIIINDKRGEICLRTAKEFENNGYKVIILDLKNNELGNTWNPLTLAYKLYKEGKKSESTKLIEEIGYYILYEQNTTDSFWLNSARDYFVGLTLYLFENGKEEEINLNSIFSISNTINEETNLTKFIKKLDKNSTIYYNLSGTLTSPKETRGGIISTFIERVKRFISNENINNLISATDFDLTNITKEKTAIFIMSGINDLAPAIVPLFVRELIYIRDNYGNKEKRINVILDEFDEINPILNFTKILHYSRGINIRFTLLIRSFKGIEEKYSKEVSDTVISSFANLIYLWSNDLYTVTEISNLCGSTPNELKTLKKFNAIIFRPRLLPYKTELLPDYKMKWDITDEAYIIPNIKKNTIKIFEIKL